MINLPRIVLVLFGLSALLDIADIDGIVIVCETIATILKNSKKLVKILEKMRAPPK